MQSRQDPGPSGVTSRATASRAAASHAAASLAPTTEDLLITGASGFLGAQFATSWLHRHPRARIACLIRAADDADANARLTTALTRAVHDQAMPVEPGTLIERATAIRGELLDLDWLGAARSWAAARPADRAFGIVHCAANLSFRPADRDAVRQTNIDGTRTMLTAAREMPQAAAFNYVSTAYTAGDRSGDIAEDQTVEAPGFSNAYEESKWEAEALVRDTCVAAGLPFRILRPSIIIAHSVTHRMSALSGFYKVAETMMQLGRLPRNRGEAILLPIQPGATLDLIPVDVVVAEMIQVLEAGRASENQAFHLTSDSPLGLLDVLTALSPLAGLSIGALPNGDEAATPIAQLMMQRLRHYMPYFSQVRRFDRSRTHALGVAQQDNALDVERLRLFVDAFLADQAA